MRSRLRSDIRQGLRSLARSPRYAAWIVGSLAIGMASTTAAFALLNALLFQPFPGVGGQDSLVRITVAGPCAGAACAAARSLQHGEAEALAALPALTAVAASRPATVSVGIPQARTMRAVYVSSGYFDVLQAGAAIGRLPDDRAPEGVVLAHRTWQDAFGADPGVLGRSIRVGDRALAIVGVAPPLFAGVDLRPSRGDRGPDLWLPLAVAAAVPQPAGDPSYDLSFVGRVREGLDRKAVAAQAEALAGRLSGPAASGPVRPRVEVVAVSIGNPRHRSLTVAVVLPIPLLVLVIACVNAAHVMLARGADRRREMAIRLALGAGRSRIVRELLVESVVLAGVASLVALPLAWCALWLADSPLGLPVGIDGTVLALSAGTGLATTLAFGLGPALTVSDIRPSSTLGVMGTRDGASPGRSRLRRALLVGEVALSIALLGTAWQLVATARAQAVGGDVPADRLLVARFDLAPVLPPEAHEPFYRDVLAQSAALPGVERAGLAPATAIWTFGQRPARLQVWTGDGDGQGRAVGGSAVSPGVFEAVGMRTMAGRGFTAADGVGPPASAVITAAAARRLGGGAVGSVLHVAAAGRPRADAVPVHVVGVVSGVVEPRLDRGEEPEPRVYLSAPLEPAPALALYVRTRGEAVAVAQPLRDLVGRLAPTVPILELGSLAELNARSYAPQLWLARTAAGLGLLALALATAGLHGVASHGVTTRRRELAVRMAVGAAPGAIVRLVLAETLRVAALGLVIGGIAAVVVSRAIQAGWHGIERLDAAALGGAAMVFTGAMLAASAAPAWRASRLDPVETLKDA